MRSPSPEPTEKMRLRNRRNGSSGCSTYASQRTNAAISAAPAAVSPAAAALPGLGPAFLDAHERQQEQADAGHQQRRPGEVNPRRSMHRGYSQHDPDDRERRAADRQVDEKHPAPGYVVDDETAQQGADDAGEHPHAGQVADVAAALPGRDDVPDDSERQAHHPSGADALHAARKHQCQHSRREPARTDPNRKTRMAAWNVTRRP